MYTSPPNAETAKSSVNVKDRTVFMRADSAIYNGRSIPSETIFWWR
jgi:hypothetical protein